MELYESQPYLRRAEGKVLDLKDDQGTWIRLDRTIFYPEGGGQPADTGWMELHDQRIQVVDVQEGAGAVWHKIEGDQPALGTPVQMEIDWDRRYHFMKSHTGEHMVSGIIYKLFGFDNIGFHMNEDLITCDFNGPLGQADLDRLVLELNQAIQANKPVVSTYPGQDQIVWMDYRAKKPLEGPIRLTQVKDCDLCACCGLHVAFTGEIGIGLLTDAINYKGGSRLTFQFGMKAIQTLIKQQAALKHVTTALSCNTDSLIDRFELFQTGQEDLKTELRDLSQRFLDLVSEGVSEAQVPLFLFQEGLSARDLKWLAKKLEDKRSRFCLLIPSEENGFVFLIADRDGQAQRILQDFKNVFEVRGGGTKTTVQGQIMGDLEALKEFWNRISQ